MRIIIALLFACVAANSFAATHADIETRFKLAMADTRSGQTQRALEKLGELAAETNAPRIKLELARLLMASGDNAKALALFREIYRAPETPQLVRRNILPFIEEAELRVVRIRYGARIITDSNPSRIGDGGTVYFNGIPLEYQPPARKKTSYGIEPWFLAEKLWSNGLMTKFNASARLFESSELTSGQVQLALGRRVTAVPGLFVQVKLDTEIARDNSYVLPSIEAWKRFRLSPAAGVGIGGQIGHMTSQNSDVSGPFYRGYIFGDWTFRPDATVFSRLSAEALDSRNDFYDYVSAKIDFGFAIDAGRGFHLVPEISWKQTVFPEYNSFWGVTRKDLTIKPSITVSNESLEWNGIRPEVSVFYEKRNSNISIYDYNQIGSYINLKKMF